MKRTGVVVLLFLAVWLGAAQVLAEDLSGEVVKVHDGDTLRVRVDCPGCPVLFRVWGVRIRGIDTPELSDSRPEYQALAVEAGETLAALCPQGARVVLRDVSFDKYGGRLLAGVECPNGDAAEVLKARGVAREYGGRGKKPW